MRALGSGRSAITSTLEYILDSGYLPRIDKEW